MLVYVPGVARPYLVRVKKSRRRYISSNGKSKRKCWYTYQERIYVVPGIIPFCSSSRRRCEPFQQRGYCKCCTYVSDKSDKKQTSVYVFKRKMKKKMLPTRAGRRWQMVWQGPRLGSVAETARFVAMVPCFLLSVFRFSFLSFPLLSLHPGMFIFLLSLRLCSIHVTLSKYVFYTW